jgi:hypothetical protein
MDQILKELNNGPTVLLEVEKLQDFWEYCKTQKNLYSFRYDYIDQLVKITLTDKK